MTGLEDENDFIKFEVHPPLSHELHKHPLVSLINLPTGKYVDTLARVASLKVREIEDELGTRRVFLGILEDGTFKVPFVCHKIGLPFEKNVVLLIRSVYVHEFEDRALLLVFSEYTKAEPKHAEDIGEYVWHPKISRIRRPVWNVILRGIVSKIQATSGLVKRCSKCKAIFYEECVNGCKDEWNWDLRISANLLDSTGSIKMILGRCLSSRLLQRNLGDIFLLATEQSIPSPEGYDVLSFNLDVPELDIVEAVVEDPNMYRHHENLVISDCKTRIYCPASLKLYDYIKISVRRLVSDNAEDFMVLRRLIRKALDINIVKITGKPYVHGIHLLEDPITLYGCEKAQLYLGFSTSVNNTNEKIVVEASPQAYIRESVWDYIRWRRNRGASASSIKRRILENRTKVVLSPFGHLGRIEGFVFKKAGEERVSEVDDRSFTQFWCEVYDVEVDPSETPLLKIRLMSLDIPLTYPPSCVYFDRDVLFLTTEKQRYIERKRLPLKGRTQAVMEKVLNNLRIGDVRLKYLGENSHRVDVQRLLLYEIQQKLLGRTVKARGNITQLRDRFYFLPNTIVKVG